MDVILKNNKGFKWFSSEGIYFKGYFYINSDFYEQHDAISVLQNINSKQDFTQLLKTINGVYSIIFTLKEHTYIVNDTTRSFPLFYSNSNDRFIISDTIHPFQKETINPTTEDEIRYSLHCYGNKTLYKDIYITQSNECISIHNEKIIRQHFFFSYASEGYINDSYNNLKEQTITVFENSFKRFISSIKNRQVVIPLSGGFDSRLIACMLKKHGHSNVICYTYGHKDSFEIENSKQVAKQLNFKWHFIEYSNDLIDNYSNTTMFKEFAHYAGKYSSTPNLQEYFAIQYLTTHQLVNNDAIFVPGYAGDMLGGSQFIKVIPKALSHKDLIDTLVSEKFHSPQYTIQERKTIKNTIKTCLENFDPDYLNKIPHTVFEDFDLKERLTKYIFNSASFYSYFGYEFRFPFWDKALLSHFKNIPIEHKLYKTLFNDVLINNYFKPFDVYFNTELDPTPNQLKSVKTKTRLKQLIPNALIRKFLQKSDWNNYNLITTELLAQIKTYKLPYKKTNKGYNQIVAQWYLYFCKNKFK